MANGKAGRPSTYSEEVADAICGHLIDGMSLRAICRRTDMPAYMTVVRWMEAHGEFESKCVRARVLQADAIHDDMADVEDKTLAGRIAPDVARVVLSSKQWRASKLAPKKYGERQQIDHGVTGSLESLIRESYKSGGGDAENK